MCMRVPKEINKEWRSLFSRRAKVITAFPERFEEYTWSVNSFHSEESVDPRLGDKSRSGILVGSPLGRVENIAHGKGGGGERSGLPSEALTDP